MQRCNRCDWPCPLEPSHLLHEAFQTASHGAEGWALLCWAQVRTTINTCRTKHRSVSPQDGFNYSTTRLMAKVIFRV